MIPRAIVGAALVASVCATPAMAWTQKASETECWFAQTFEGPGLTTVVIGQTRQMFDDGSVLISVANDNWSISKDDRLPDKLTIKTGGKVIPNINPVWLDHGFVFKVSPATLATLAQVSDTAGIEIFKGTALVDSLSFSGIYVARLEFDRCVDKWRKEVAARRHQEAISKLPVDPFAKPGK